MHCSPECVLMWECPYTVCVCPVALVGERAGFDVNTSHIFPQGVLVVVILVGGGIGDGGARAGPRCELGLPLCLMAVTALL